MGRQLRVLLIQDDPADAAGVRDALTGSADSSFLVEWVRSCEDALVRLVGQAPHRAHSSDDIAAVLVDLFLPDSKGIQTFNRLMAVVPHLPILILTGSEHESIAKIAVQHGAQDYLLKTRLDNYLLPKALVCMIERAAIAEALYEEKERAQVTLDSIGDGVISCDIDGVVTYLNVAAETMTGWARQEATGHLVHEVFHVVDGTTREANADPMGQAIRGNKSTCLPPNSVLIRRDKVEAAIEDSAAPIHDRRGRVAGAVMVFHDVSTTRALSLRMSHLAQHDGLTDLPNRALLNDRLTQAIATAHRRPHNLALLFLDLDHFKRINDSLGHDVGDRLLLWASQQILGCLRGSDTVSRQGGDEFVILLTEISHSEDAAICAEKILVALRAPAHIDRHELHITASIGIVVYPNDGITAESLVKHADLAMYGAKSMGRNNYQFFKSDMNTRSIERQTLESALRRAVERQQFTLHYQPIVNLRSGSVSGLEALIRWRRPGRGLVDPGQFIAIAEQSGLIVPIGRWVVREACRQLRAWTDAGLAPMRIAINVSVVELRDRGFVAGVLAALDETGLEPRYLELELTETFLMHDSSSTAGVLHSLKGLGVQLALDDFGTGYSSLSHLKRFPIDTLKIDRSFLIDVATNPADASIVGGLISMGRDLGICVVAEGVETREQLAFLNGQGCAEAQGYYFSRPAPAADIPEILDRRSLEPKSGSLVGRLHSSRGHNLAHEDAPPAGPRPE